MTASPLTPPEGFIDPVDSFIQKTNFFWLMDDYLSTEKIFIYFCSGAMLYLWWVFPIMNKRFPKLADYTHHARIYFLLFSKIIIVKTIIKAMFLPVYGDQIRMTVDESLVVFFGSLLLMGAINEPSLKERLKRIASDLHFDDQKGRWGVYFERSDNSEGKNGQNEPAGGSTSPDTHSPTPHTATGAAPTPPESSS